MTELFLERAQSAASCPVSSSFHVPPFKASQFPFAPASQPQKSFIRRSLNDPIM